MLLAEGAHLNGVERGTRTGRIKDAERCCHREKLVNEEGSGVAFPFPEQREVR